MSMSMLAGLGKGERGACAVAMALSPPPSRGEGPSRRLALSRARPARRCESGSPSDPSDEQGRVQDSWWVEGRRAFGRAACAVGMAATLSQGALVGPSVAAARLSQEEKNAVSLFSKATPSVVFITNLTNRRDIFTLDLKEIPQGAGSGFVWDDEGHIVTNFHVIKGASDVQVTFQDQVVKQGRVVGFDEDRDIAVLQVGDDVGDEDEGSAAPAAAMSPVRTSAPSDLASDRAKAIRKENGEKAFTFQPLPRGTSEDLVVGQRVYAIG